MLYPILYNAGVLIDVLCPDLYPLPIYRLGDDYDMYGELGIYFFLPFYHFSAFFP